MRNLRRSSDRELTFVSVMFVVIFTVSIVGSLSILFMAVNLIGAIYTDGLDAVVERIWEGPEGSK